MSKKHDVQQFITWAEALEYEIKGSRLVVLAARLNWHWFHRWVSTYMVNRTTRRYNQYAAMKSKKPLLMPKK